eukprot:GEMP01012414.1.p1 GENE.GEMP01012414.1~~GEMP01012414.1.p1  ORF type:complete len:659 (+),score=211.79 GEMP01012414.1:398-2374(+)
MIRLLLILGVSAVGPVQKVIQLLGGLQSKVIAEGETEQANFEEFSRWCERQSIEKAHSIKGMKQEILGLKATIDTALANFAQTSAAIGELSSQISANEKELVDGGAQRDEEHTNFVARDADLGETLSMLMRAQSVLKKSLEEAKKHGKTSLIQTSSMTVVTDTLSRLVQASFASLNDQSLAKSLLQQAMEQSADSWSLQQPAAPASGESENGGILDIMASLQDKAEESRSAAQKEEMEAQHTFAMLKLAIDDELKSLRGQLDDSKKKKSRSDELRATAEGDFENVQKVLAAEQKALDDTLRECMSRASEFESSQKFRAEELKVLAEAKTILSAAPGDSRLIQTSKHPHEAVTSFLQVRLPPTYARQLKAADYLRKEGTRLHSWVLAQVGHKVQGDAFEKVKHMIEQMVEKLLNEQASEADKQQWCEREKSKSTQAKSKKQDKFEDVQTRIDQASSLKEKREGQLRVLFSEIAEMDSAQAEATKMRQSEHAAFVTNKADLTAGQQACATAVKVLRNYYQGDSFLQQPSGAEASKGIIGMLEVAESDFSRSLAEAQTQEDESQQEYDEQTQDFKVTKATKQQDVKNKTAEKQRLDNLVSQTTVDARDAQAELNAVVYYIEKLKGDCETKAPAFEERKARRQHEMEGLQNALSILEGKGVA